MKTTTAIAPTKEGGALTHVLSQVQHEFDVAQDEYKRVLRFIEGNRDSIIATTLAASGMEVSPRERERVSAQIGEEIDRALNLINESLLLIGRLNTVTRSVVEIAKRTEKTWKDTLMDLIRDTRWYRERFPERYEERRRKKEYERSRMRPELFHARPGAGYGREREQGFTQGNANRRLEKRAQEYHPEITEVVGSLYRRLFQIVQTYFGADSPILQASNKVVGSIKRKMGKNETVARALKDQVQVLENLFGFEKRPGRYIVSGSRAFILPAIRKLRRALDILQDPIRRVKELQRFVSEELEQDLATGQQATPAPVATPGEALTSRMKRTLERFSRVKERQKRCNFVQRLASSR